jgi:hypothetical protein
MASVLKQVLDHFEDRAGAVSLAQMARELDIEPATLQGMIDYWVRRGRLRASGGAVQACSACGIRSGCAFVGKMPRFYELATGDHSIPVSAAPCGQRPDEHADVSAPPPACSRCGPA